MHKINQLGLILTLSGSLLAGCHTKPKPTATEVATSQISDSESKVQDVVTDPDRAAKVQASLDDLTALIEEDGKSLAAHDEAIRALLLDYNATDAQFETAYADFGTERKARVLRAIQIAEDIRAQTTPEEWAALNKTRKKTLDAVTGAALSK